MHQPANTPAGGQAPDPAATEEALRRRAEQAEEIVEFVDSTSFAGDEENVTGEITNADQHPADTSDITYQRELDLTVREMAERQLQDIAEARDRQREGTYGICVNCGRPIDPERLRVRPEARTCIDCARAQEQGVGS